MRTNQIETKITRLVNGELKVFTVYSDADNFAEAFSAHCKAILDKVNVAPSFGCVEVREVAADVAPVVHAKWSKHCWEEHNYHCSNCNNLASKGAYGYNNDLTPYCPNCGAKMDGGRD